MIKFFKEKNINGLETDKAFQYEIFRKRGIPHLVTAEKFGHVDIDNAEINDKLLTSLGGLYGPFPRRPKLVYAGQPRRNEVKIVDGSERIVLGKDALITVNPGIFLTLRTADCLPILLAAFDGSGGQTKAVAAIHAGRQGLESEVIKNTVGVLRDELELNPEYFQVVIGPHICARCYLLYKDDPRTVGLIRKIGEEFIEEMKNGERAMNIEKLAIHQFTKEGLKRKYIYTDARCTYHQDIFPSYKKRREQNKTGKFNFASIIGLPR